MCTASSRNPMICSSAKRFSMFRLLLRKRTLRGSDWTRSLGSAQSQPPRKLVLADALVSPKNRYPSCLLGGLVGIHAGQFGSNLLRRPAPVDQVITHVSIQRRANGNVTRTHAPLAPSAVSLRRLSRSVPRRRPISIARQLSRDCGRAASELRPCCCLCSVRS